ncbi:MAG TPA: hypothetical protein VJZ93_01395 [Candidatus Nanoarchaeia archaeon]|nr:hypothetical protein [Candidatus Nanoarchaeia archaeon]
MTTAERILNVEELCGLVAKGGIKVGERIKVKGGFRSPMSDPNPNTITLEIVYDVVKSPVPRVDTMIIEINGRKLPGSIIPEMRYMVEGKYSVGLDGSTKGEREYHRLLETRD